MTRKKAPMSGAERNFESLRNVDLEAYMGKWITVVDAQIAFSGTDEAEILEKTRKKYPDKVPLLFRVPDEESLTL
jgi:hypothetical protein